MPGERKKEKKTVRINGKKVKLERFEGDTLWHVLEKQNG